MDDLTGFALVVVVLVVIGYVSTKRTDAEIVAAGGQLAAPEWARWLLIIMVALGGPLVIGAVLVGLSELGR
jgi:succinate dehydrogenase hydrophobic anchor subunit